jgi:hypothetical protein
LTRTWARQFGTAEDGADAFAGGNVVLARCAATI